MKRPVAKLLKTSAIAMGFTLPVALTMDEGTSLLSRIISIFLVAVISVAGAMALEEDDKET